MAGGGGSLKYGNENDLGKGSNLDSARSRFQLTKHQATAIRTNSSVCKDNRFAKYVRPQGLIS